VWQHPIDRFIEERNETEAKRFYWRADPSENIAEIEGSNCWFQSTGSLPASFVPTGAHPNVKASVSAPNRS
jgi:hypothetical protein